MVTTVTTSNLGDGKTATPFYTIEQVANLLQVHRSMISKQISAGKLQGFRIGNRTRIPEPALRAYMDGTAPPPISDALNELRGINSDDPVTGTPSMFNEDDDN